MFNIEEMIIYGSKIYQIINIVTAEKCSALSKIRGIDGTRKYYILKAIYREETIYTPIDNNKVFMRKIISKEEAEYIISLFRLPNINGKKKPTSDVLIKKFDNIHSICSYAEIVDTILEIQSKQSSADPKKRTLKETEKQFVKDVKKMINEEFSVVLGITKEDVENLYCL